MSSDIDTKPSEETINNLKSTGIIREISDGYPSPVWMESSRWKFPKENGIICQECKDYGNWQKVLSGPMVDYDEHLPTVFNICINGCLKCVKNNHWNWGEFNMGDDTFQISSNGNSSLGEYSNLNVLEDSLLNLWNSSPDYDPPKWGQLYNMIPQRVKDIICYVFDIQEIYNELDEINPGYAQEIMGYGPVNFHENNMKKETIQKISHILYDISNDIPEGNI